MSTDPPSPNMLALRSYLSVLDRGDTVPLTVSVGGLLLSGTAINHKAWLDLLREDFDSETDELPAESADPDKPRPAPSFILRDPVFLNLPVGVAPRVRWWEVRIAAIDGWTLGRWVPVVQAAQL